MLCFNIRPQLSNCVLVHVDEVEVLETVCARCLKFLRHSQGTHRRSLYEVRYLLSFKVYLANEVFLNVL